MLPIHRTNTWLPDVFNDFTPRVSNTSPAINVIESEKEYKVELAAPGMKKEDFDVQINENGDLHIKLENKQEKKDEDKNTHYLRREFSYTKFEQTLILPEDVDKEKISAKVEHGVLTVDLPKIEQKPTPKIGRKVEVI